MELGPFSVSEIEPVKSFFESKGVSFEILIDKDAEAEMLAGLQAATMSLDLKIVYFEINDADYDKVKHGLEKYGVMAMSDGSYELGED